MTQLAHRLPGCTIEDKATQVREAYAVHGFHSPEYQHSFDELHDMRMADMAHKFRAARGLPPQAKTPYCPTH